jgi:uncharacterized membrane protein YcjF (UPF0283 family)
MNKNTSEIIPLSDAISSPIIKAYKAGGLGLTFIFIGTFLLLAALFFHQGSWISYLSATLGTLMILAVLYLFYIKDIRQLQELSQKINRNKELIDTIQKAAIEMTDLSYELQALAFKYSNEVASELSQIRPIVREIKDLPLISHLPGIDKLRCQTSQKIFEADSNLK